MSNILRVNMKDQRNENIVDNLISKKQKNIDEFGNLNVYDIDENKEFVYNYGNEKLQFSFSNDRKKLFKKLFYDNKNLFLNGEAGTGKTNVLKFFIAINITLKNLYYFINKNICDVYTNNENNDFNELLNSLKQDLVNNHDKKEFYNKEDYYGEIEGFENTQTFIENKGMKLFSTNFNNENLKDTIFEYKTEEYEDFNKKVEDYKKMFSGVYNDISHIGIIKEDKIFFIPVGVLKVLVKILHLFGNFQTKNPIVLGSTGISALNVGGSTIHSFFSFGIEMNLDKEGDLPNLSPEKVKILRSADMIIIDEISMVRADLMDNINKTIKKNITEYGNDTTPFGGLQLLLVGDLLQLPPVVQKEEKEILYGKYKSEFFFDSEAYKQINIETYNLKDAYRQEQGDFLNILNNVRIGKINKNQNDKLNERTLQNLGLKEGKGITLCTRNKDVEEINNEKLEKLPGELYVSNGIYINKENGGNEELIGNDIKQQFPAPNKLYLKEGSQVMFTVNTDMFKNGTIGYVKEISPEKNTNEISYLNIELENGESVILDKYTWNTYNPTKNEETGSIENRISGTFTQYPLKLSWATTIHKSQGLTFNNATINLGKGSFVPGQTYVALSRIKSLEGLYLQNPIREKDIFANYRVINFLKNSY